ncbi:MAG: Rrf2 family transcriptional regulator [Gammaproteobacteria bacterium]|nr:Rrf2 family transcriptional regulator [Gammaproteobacteria bacterium]MBU1601644.1 Rrf2 family transcriptional regulator [Gammaproteobacteria bacterium]MBU2434723.1 Rrf2 family transcriptional regulator [Gammaproteobacteria bacterium]MBU2447964.1 Rrf2 family transcriptional regulator [Gammaproteobacteria bacterium]
MRLSTFSDYSLRVLMYLGVQDDRLVTIAEIASVHDISKSHLMKVVHQLGLNGHIETVRGKGGGMRLARAPREIVVGDVIRQSESDFALAECFASGATCRIQGACGLPAILNEALSAMFLVLDGYTLADLLQRPHGLVPAAPCALVASQAAGAHD